MTEGLDQNKKTLSPKEERLLQYQKDFEGNLDYFSSYIKTLPDRIDSIRTIPLMNEILLKQKEFVYFCKENHPEEYESLKNAMLNNKAIVEKQSRFKEIDNTFFNFE